MPNKARSHLSLA